MSLFFQAPGGLRILATTHATRDLYTWHTQPRTIHGASRLARDGFADVQTESVIPLGWKLRVVSPFRGHSQLACADLAQAFFCSPGITLVMASRGRKGTGNAGSKSR